MRDLIDPRWMYLKAWLFLLAGLGAGAILLLENPSLRTLALIAIVAWSFSRLYYFAIYVIERYIDPSFRFAGVGSAIAYAARNRAGLAARPNENVPPRPRRDA